MEATLKGLPLPLRFLPPEPMTDEDLLRFCERQEVLVVEREPDGWLSVQQLPGMLHSMLNARITSALAGWHKIHEIGVAVGSNCGFILPDGSMRTPDAAWVSDARLGRHEPDTRDHFPHACPELIVELRSYLDSPLQLHDRMNMWFANGTELGWLIDAKVRNLTVYRPDHAPELLEHPTQVAGEGPVAGFVLPLDRIFT